MSVEEATQATTSVSEPKPRRAAAVKATAATTTQKKVPKAKGEKAPKKEKKATNHPGYLDMIVAALKGLQEKKGSSKAAIVNYILAHYEVGDDKTWLNTKVKLALKRGLDSKKLQQSSGSGANGRIRLVVKQSVAKAPKAKAAPKKAAAVKKAPAAKKPAASKAKKASAPKKAKAAPAKAKAPAKKPKAAPKKTAAKRKSA